MSEKSKPRWNPAAVAALAKGDLANAIIAATPGGIEAQEAQGQQDFVASETLPFRPNNPNQSEEELRQQLESLGIEFVEQVDKLFWYVHLPPGWKKVPTDHSMWSDLVDDKGRKRAGIFYKAAFYDRRATIYLKTRYNYTRMPVGGWDEWGPGTRYHGIVTDCDEVIWETEPGSPEPEEYDHEWSQEREALSNQARGWLDEHHPEWRDPLAYWD